jgi:hypothetical protein
VNWIELDWDNKTCCAELGKFKKCVLKTSFSEGTKDRKVLVIDRIGHSGHVSFICAPMGVLMRPYRAVPRCSIVRYSALGIDGLIVPIQFDPVHQM